VTGSSLAGCLPGGLRRTGWLAGRLPGCWLLACTMFIPKTAHVFGNIVVQTLYNPLYDFCSRKVCMILAGKILLVRFVYDFAVVRVQKTFVWLRSQDAVS
jgi:hypothetical protein